MSHEEAVVSIARKHTKMLPVLNERSRRLWAAIEAESLGRGGISIVAEAVKIDPKTIRKGIREINHTIAQADHGRVRREGGGRKKITEIDATILTDLDRLIEPDTRGDPEAPLLWISKSVRAISAALASASHSVSRMSAVRLLKRQGFSLQSNRKRREGSNHPDRDAQFRHISATVKRQQRNNQPCISVDTKKKENIGRYKNSGREWRRSGKPIEVNMHDFPDKHRGKAAPYGVYDLMRNEGWVNVGITADTAEFAVESIRRWWRHMGSARYPKATELLITADCGGSNGYRNRLWKRELQHFATETGLRVNVRHFPPGTSKWNKIEHRMFSFISKNWRGRPLDTLATIINLIGNTTTTTGLLVRAMLDENIYTKGIKVSDAEFATIRIKRDSFHPEWNYMISPASG